LCWRIEARPDRHDPAAEIPTHPKIGACGIEVETIMMEENPDAEFAVVSNPEFLREGAAIRDFKHPDRVVIGVNNARAREIIAEVYRPLHLNAQPTFTPIAARRS
jgi:UDP-glucose 6-dehydrogenase